MGDLSLLVHIDTFFVQLHLSFFLYKFFSILTSREKRL
jgi:hypothetical protein